MAIVDVERRSSGVAAGRSRKEKMSERTKAWVRGLQDGMIHHGSGGEAVSSLWVPILPFEAEMQREYLDHLEEAKAGSIQGVVVYDDHSLSAIPSVLSSLPRMSLTEPRTPHQVLTSVSLGVDLFAIPFITAVSEAGIAFRFSFPIAPVSEKRLPLGIDIWATSHATDSSPLQASCDCYTCKAHHRAYIHHLLNAKEMLAWVLLQVHNHHIMDRFFEGVRTSIGNGSFKKDGVDFERAYEAEFPEFVGQGPRFDLSVFHALFSGIGPLLIYRCRVRGYHDVSTGAGPKKRNKPAWGKFSERNQTRANNQKPKIASDRAEEVEESKEVPPMSPNADAMDLEDLGFAKLYE